MTMIPLNTPLAFLAICASILFTAPVAASATQQADVDAYRALIKQDVRLATVGYRLAATNAAFCKNKSRNPGWVIHDIAQYPRPDIARAAFGFDQPIHVAAVVENGPADVAKIQPNDGFTGMDDATLYWPAMPLGKTGYERMASFKSLLMERIGNRALLPLQFSRGGKTIKTTLSAPLICASDFQIDTANGINAGANGNMVSVSLAMAEFTNDDTELAAIVAHELAHNLLQHPEKLKSLRVKRGLSGQFGKSKNAVRFTETEADQLSIWLLGNAGYNPNAAIAFFQRLGNRPGRMLMIDRTHLPWKDRIVIMQEQAKLYAQAAKINGKAHPSLLMN